MHPPPSYHSPHKDCKLHKTLYGLKQTPRARFSKFRSTLTQLDFLSRSYDSALLTQKIDIGIVILLLYVKGTIFHGLRLSSNSYSVFSG